jgi:integrase
LAPKRHIPPKRHTVKEDELSKLYDACKGPQDRAIVALLSNTGLRASEACALNWGDIELDDMCLTVQNGKGGKRRRVGLNTSAMAALSKLMETQGQALKANPIFLDANGKRLTPRGLHARLERIGKAAGVTANPHALRRAFVTINAGKGRSLVHLQRACGHSSIETTMAYCRTSEQEVIDAMRDW